MVVKNSEKVELYNMNGDYISKPISLVTGNYRLTHFFVLDWKNNVVYASPIKGSPKASLVQSTLPISFNIQHNKVTKLNPEVISTVESKPEDFGYVTFGFDVANTFDFLIGAFVYNDSVKNFELTSADITILNGTTVIYNGQLKAIQNNLSGIVSGYDSIGVTNKITLPEKYNAYTLTISKRGFKTYSQTFTKEQLKLHLRSVDKGPLVILLEKSTLDDGLVAYYKFNGNAIDYSGFNNNGTYYGRGFYTSGRLNDPNSALDLNGSGDYVEIPNSSSLNPTNQLTISLWLKIDTFLNRYTAVIAKGGPTTDGFTNREYLVHFNNDGYICIESSGDNQSHNYAEAAIPGLKSWFLFSAIIDRVNHKMQVYINGQLKIQIDDSYSSFTINSYSLKIGAWNESNPEYSPFFKGGIDELKIYNRALSQEEILSLYHL
jgi:hypothetical protein